MTLSQSDVPHGIPHLSLPLPIHLSPYVSVSLCMSVSACLSLSLTVCLSLRHEKNFEVMCVDFLAVSVRPNMTLCL